MHRIFDSSIYFVALQLEEELDHLSDGCRKNLTSKVNALLIGDDVDLISSSECSATTDIDSIALFNLTQAVTSIAARNYLAANAMLRLTKTHPEKAPSWHFSIFAAEMLLRLFMEKPLSISRSSSWVDLLAAKPQTYRFDFMLNWLIFSSMAKLPLLNTSEPWFDGMNSLLNSASLMYNDLEGDLPNRYTRLLQAKGAFASASSRYGEASDYYKAALDSLDLSGQLASVYKPELLAEIAYCLAAQKRWNESLLFIEQAREYEWITTRDSLRLGKIAFQRGETLYGKGAQNEAFESYQAASKHYSESSDNAYFGDRLIILHRMNMLSLRLGRHDDRRQIKQEIQALQHRFDCAIDEC